MSCGGEDLHARGPEMAVDFRCVRLLILCSFRRPWPVLLAVITLVAAGASQLPQLRLRLDARSLIPEGHPALAVADAARQRFGLHDTLVIGVVDDRRGAFHLATLRTVQRLSERLESVDGVHQVTSLATLPRLHVEGNRLSATPLLAANVLDGDVAEQVRRETVALGLDDGVLVAKDHRSTAIFVSLAENAERDQVLRRVRALLSAETDGSRQLFLTGTPLAQLELGAAVLRDLLRLLPGTFVVLLALLFYTYRHPFPIFLILTKLGMTLVVTAGLMSAFGQPVFVTILVLPVLVLVIAVSDDVYALDRCLHALCEEGSDAAHREVVLIALYKVARPIEFSAATTAAASLSLTVTELEPYRMFGIFGAVGIAASLILTLTFIPAVLALSGSGMLLKAGRCREHVARRQRRLIARLAGLSRHKTIVGLAAVALASGALATQVRVNDSWVRNLPRDSWVAQSDAALNRALAGTTALEFLVEDIAGAGFLAPDTAHKVLLAEKAISENPAATVVHGVYDNILRLNASLSGLEYAAYRDPRRDGKIMLTEAELAQGAMLVDTLRRAPLPRRLSDDFTQGRITVHVASADYQTIRSLLGDITAAFDAERTGIRLTAFGEGWVGFVTVKIAVDGQLRTLAAALGLNLLLAALLFRSFRDAFLVILPVSCSVLGVFACLTVFDIPLGIATAMFSAITLGAGIDYAIHLVAEYRAEQRCGARAQDAMARALGTTGPATVTAALSVAGGISVFLLSGIPPNLELGLLIGVSLMICAVVSMVMVPTLALLRGVR